MRQTLVAATLLALTCAQAFAGEIAVSGAWTRATMRGSSVGVGYFTVSNAGKDSDRLTGVACACAQRAEIHESREVDGVMTMRAAPPEGVEVKAGSELVFKPGGFHVMLIGLKSAFFPGETVHVTLHFAGAGDVGADLKVEGFGATAPEAAPDAKAKPEQDEPPSVSY